MKKLLVTAFLFTAILAAYAADMVVYGKHLENGVSCEDCHETDKPVKRAPDSACKSCHGEYPEVAELTKELEINPHASHQGEPRCTLCHKTHEPSVLMCNQCHSFDMQVN